MGILSYFFTKDNPVKLLELYKNSQNANEKQKIVNRLIELNAANELWQIKGNLTHVKQICGFLLKHYSSDNAKLLELHRNGDKEISDKVVKQLMNNEATNELWELKDDINPDFIYNFIQEHYKNNPKKLYELYSELDPITAFLAQSISMTYSEYYESHKNLLKFIVTDKYLAEFFMHSLNNRQRLYLLLLHYSGKLDLNGVEDWYNNIEDCVYENLIGFTSKFDDYYNKGLQSLKTEDLIFAYLIDKSAYKNKITEIKRTKSICNDLNKSTEDIKNKYVNLKKNANSKAEIDQYLAKEKEEINNLFSQSSYNILNSIIGTKNVSSTPEIIMPDLTTPKISGKMIDLSSITTNHRVTLRYADDCKNIEADLEKQLYQLNDSDSIMKAKAQAKQKKELLIAKNDLLHTLQKSNPKLADDARIIETIGNLLVRYNDLDTQKEIINFSSTSRNHKWLKSVLNVAGKNTEDVLNVHIFNSLINKISAWNLRYLSGLVNSKLVFKEVHSYRHDSYVHSVAFSPDGQCLASVSYDKTVKIVRLSDFKEVYSYRYNDSVYSIYFSPDGQYLASRSDDKTVKIVRLSDFKEVYSYRHDSYVRSVAFSPDGQYFAIGSDYTVIIMRLSDFKEVYNYKHGYYVCNVAFSPDGQYIAIRSGNAIRIVRLSDFKEMHSYSHDYDVISVAFSPDGQCLASGSYDKTVKIVRLSDFKEVYSYRHNDSVYSIYFSTDGQYLASGSDDKTVKIVRLSDFKEVHSYRHDSYVRSVAFSPDGQYLAIGSGEGIVKIVQIADITQIFATLFLNHLLHLYFNAGDDDIKSLIEYKNSINSFNNLSDEQKSALLPLVEEIIEKAGRKSKSPALATEVNVKIKDIEIAY